MTGAGQPSGLSSALARLWSGESVALILGIAQAIVVAGVLSVGDYGAGGLAFAVAATIFVFLDPQTEEAIYRFGGEAKVIGDTARIRELGRFCYSLDGALAAVGFAIAAALSIPLAAWLLDDRGLWYLVALAAAGAAANAPNTTARAVLTLLGDTAAVARVAIVAAVGRFATAVAGAALFGLTGYVVAIVAFQVIESTLLVASARRHLRRFDRPSRPWWRFRIGDDTGTVVRYLAYTDLTTLASSAVKQLDVVILGVFRPLADVGGYRLARSVAAASGAIVRPLQAVAFPVLAAAGTARPAAMRAEIVRFAKRFSFPLVALGVVGVAALPLVLRIVLPAEYDTAITPAVILGVGALISVAVFWLRPSLLVLGYERALFVISLAMTIATVVGYVVGASSMGAEGVAVSRVLFASAVGNLIAAVLLRRRLGDHDDAVASA